MMTPLFFLIYSYTVIKPSVHPLKLGVIVAIPKHSMPCTLNISQVLYHSIAFSAYFKVLNKPMYPEHV